MPRWHDNDDLNDPSLEGGAADASRDDAEQLPIDKKDLRTWFRRPKQHGEEIAWALRVVALQTCSTLKVRGDLREDLAQECCVTILKYLLALKEPPSYPYSYMASSCHRHIVKKLAQYKKHDEHFESVPDVAAVSDAQHKRQGREQLSNAAAPAASAPPLDGRSVAVKAIDQAIRQAATAAENTENDSYLVAIRGQLAALQTLRRNLTGNYRPIKVPGATCSKDRWLELEFLAPSSKPIRRRQALAKSLPLFDVVAVPVAL